MKILIVDDVEFTRLIIEEALNLIQANKNIKISLIEQAAGFKEALKKLKNHNFDIIITDLKLKDGLGTELAQLVKKKFPETKIIALTMYPEEFKNVKEIFNCFIKKPISPEELEEKLVKIIK